MVNTDPPSAASGRLRAQLLDTNLQPVGASFSVRLTPAVDGHTENEETLPVSITHTCSVNKVRLSMDGQHYADISLVQTVTVQAGDAVSFSPGALSITFDGPRAQEILQQVVEISGSYLIEEEPTLADLRGSLFEPVS